MIYIGDCGEVLSWLDDGSVDLIVTSPPYAASTLSYPNACIPANDYVEWFEPIAKEMLRVLKPTGSFILNVREHVVGRERSPYVLQLVLALRELGYCWIEQYIWHKSSTFYGRKRWRLANAWEHLHHFSKTIDFKIDIKNVSRPPSERTMERSRRALRRFHETGEHQPIQRNPNGTGYTHDEKQFIKYLDPDKKVMPTNVLHCAPQRSRSHPAAFPFEIPEFFIKLLTEPGDTVLDPFLGSGTTYIQAQKLTRKAIGIEIERSMVRESLRGEIV